MNPGIRAAYDRVHEAERDRDYLIRTTYLVGDVVCYQHGKFSIAAEVLEHSNDRLKVRGLHSGKEYWIDAYRIII